MNFQTTTPQATIDGGSPLSYRWNDTFTVEVSPGTHVVSMWAPLRRKKNYGLTDITVNVPDGYGLTLTFKGPLTLFGKGTIHVKGVTPYPGPPAAEAQVVPDGIVLAGPGGSVPTGVAPIGAVAAAPALPTAAPAAAQPEGWYGDPMARYQFRWWDGATWTAAVSTNGVVGQDPIQQ